MKNSWLIVILAFGIYSCQYGLKNGEEISNEDKEFIRELGILDADEDIILINSQSGSSDELKQAANFYSTKRLASYWLDENNDAKTLINSAYFHEIDTILLTDLSKDWANTSYLRILKKDSTEFNVYVDGDSITTWTFFNGAIKAWKKGTDTPNSKQHLN